jgi:hypothetical protein
LVFRNVLFLDFWIITLFIILIIIFFVFIFILILIIFVSFVRVVPLFFWQFEDSTGVGKALVAS